MRMSPSVARRTLNFLRRTIPRGQAEADDLLQLIEFFEQAMRDGRNSGGR